MKEYRFTAEEAAKIRELGKKAFLYYTNVKDKSLRLVLMGIANNAANFEKSLMIEYRNLEQKIFMLGFHVLENWYEVLEFTSAELNDFFESLRSLDFEIEQRVEIPNRITIKW